MAFTIRYIETIPISPRTTTKMSFAAAQRNETKNETRRGFGFDASEFRFVYLRRPHPRDPVELCFGAGDHTCAVVKLTPKQLSDLAKDAVALHFTTQVLA